MAIQDNSFHNLIEKTESVQKKVTGDTVTFHNVEKISMPYDTCVFNC